MNTTKKRQKITPFLWYNNQAEDAMNFYVSIFPNSEITLLKRWPTETPFPSDSTKPGSVQQGSFTLDGCRFYAFDAGPMFKFSSSISFFATYETEAEIDALWKKLSEDGEILMPLDNYDWSERYGWVTDRFGVSWQLMKGDVKEVGQRITPLLMYSGEQRGNAEEAMNLYMSVFENSSSDGVMTYGADGPAPEGMVMHAQCKLSGQTFMLMDNGTESVTPFTEAISLYVNCKDQKEVDYFWNRFTEEGKESMCGWLKDKFGVSWQIVPEFISEKVTQGEPQRIQQMMGALSQMKKLDVATLEEAYNQ